MDNLSSCYFCGTGIDEPLATYLLGEHDRRTTVTLCPGCRRKLDTVLDAVDAGGTTLPTTDSAGVATDADRSGSQPPDEPRDDPLETGADASDILVDPGLDEPIDGDSELDETAAGTHEIIEETDTRADERSLEDRATSGATDQHTSGATDQATSETTDQPTSETTDQPTSETTDQPTSETTDQATPVEESGESAPGDPIEESSPEEESAGSALEDSIGKTIQDEESDGSAPEDSIGESSPEEKSDGSAPEDSIEESTPEDGEESVESAPEDSIGESPPDEESTESVPEDPIEESTPEDGEESVESAPEDPIGGSSPDEGSDGSEDRAGEPAGQGANGSAGQTGQSARTSVSALEYNKVMRLLQNREFPVDRDEIETVASSAYDLTRSECAAVIDIAVDRDLIDEEGGQLLRPEQ